MHMIDTYFAKHSRVRFCMIMYEHDILWDTVDVYVYLWIQWMYIHLIWYDMFMIMDIYVYICIYECMLTDAYLWDTGCNRK